MPAVPLSSWLLLAAFASCVSHVNGPGSMFGWSRCWKGRERGGMRAEKIEPQKAGLLRGTVWGAVSIPQWAGMDWVFLKQFLFVCLAPSSPGWCCMPQVGPWWPLLTALHHLSDRHNCYFCVPKVSKMFLHLLNASLHEG